MSGLCITGERPSLDFPAHAGSRDYPRKRSSGITFSRLKGDATRKLAVHRYTVKGGVLGGPSHIDSPPSAVAEFVSLCWLSLCGISTQDSVQDQLSIVTESLDRKDGYRYNLRETSNSTDFLLLLELKMSYSFDAEDADLILRSTNSKEFRVHRCILSIASPVFRNMLTFPQPHDPDHQLPHVDLPETTTTLNILLRYIYPIPSPKIEDFTTLCNVLVSAEKYEAEGVISRLRTILISSHFLDLHPLRVYATACRWSFIEEAKLASTRTVFVDLVKEGEGCTEDMKYMSGLDYHRLLVLQQARKDKVQKAVADQPAPGGCCSIGYNDIKKLLMEEMLRKDLDVSRCLSVLDGSEKFKPCKNGSCSMGHAKLGVFVKGVMNGMGELPASI